MEQNKKLSLKVEVEKEARKIEKQIADNPDLEDIKVSDRMEEALLAEIRAYEKKCASEHENKNIRMDGTAEELSEELAPNFTEPTNEDNVIHLSNEDMEALRLGRELMKKKREEGELHEVHTEYHKHLNSDHKGKEERKSKGEKSTRIRMPRKKKFVIALAAVMVLVLGTSVTSVGSKSYWKELFDGLLGNQSSQKINVKDMDIQETEDGEEITAYREIREDLGFVPVRLGFKPENMKVKRSSIDTDQRRAFIFYTYEGRMVRYAIYENDSDSSLGQNKEDVLNDTFEVETSEQTVKIKEYSVKGYEDYRYIADFSYKGINYQLKGIMEKEQMINIIRNLIYFNKNT